MNLFTIFLGGKRVNMVGQKINCVSGVSGIGEQKVMCADPALANSICGPTPPALIKLQPHSNPKHLSHLTLYPSTPPLFTDSQNIITPTTLNTDGNFVHPIRSPTAQQKISKIKNNHFILLQGVQYRLKTL